MFSEANALDGDNHLLSGGSVFDDVNRVLLSHGFLRNLVSPLQVRLWPLQGQILFILKKKHSKKAAIFSAAEMVEPPIVKTGC